MSLESPSEQPAESPGPVLAKMSKGGGYKGTELGRATFFSPREGKGTRVHLGPWGDPPLHSYVHVWLLVIIAKFPAAGLCSCSTTLSFGTLAFSLANLVLPQ